MVTGGIAPNRAGRVSPAAAKMTSLKEATPHRVVTDAVHQHGGKIAMQVRASAVPPTLPHTSRASYTP